MPDHYSKWKLNKAEQKKVDDDERSLIAQLVEAGKTQKEAEKQATKEKDVQVKALGQFKSFVVACSCFGAVLGFGHHALCDSVRR